MRWWVVQQRLRLWVRRKRRRLPGMRWGIPLFFGLAFLSVLAFDAILSGQGVFRSVAVPASPETIAGTARAIDGDTIRVNTSIKVRLSGVAAPERDERGGPEATAFMKRLVNGKTVRCDLNGERTYDRLVGTCYVDGRDIGEAVIEAGLARDCPRYSGGRYAHVEPPQAASLPFPGYCRVR